MNNAPAGMTLTDSTGNQIQRTAETSQAAMTAQAEAEVKARYTMALARPRSADNARVRLLAECKRAGFARAAIYSKPVGGKRTEGLSIRFAESAFRAWGNAEASASVILDDREKRIVRVRATDLETNASYSFDCVIEKTVERHETRAGDEVISSRVNSQGKTTYRIVADENSLPAKVGAEVAKARRNVILAMIPADILDDCKAQAYATMRADDEADPERAKKDVIDAFAGINVLPADLEKHIGHPLAQLSPAEVEDLRGLFVAIRDGDLTWAAVAKAEAGDPAVEGPKEKAKEKIRARGKK